MAFTKVSVKGAPLTAAEHDANWTEAESRIAALEGGGAYTPTITSTVAGTTWTLTIDGDSFVATIPSAAQTPSTAVTIAAATMALATTDANKFIRCTAACAVTVPAQADVAFSGNMEAHFMQAGTGAIAFVPGTGVTINTRAELASGTTEQWQKVTLKRVASNEWDLF